MKKQILAILLLSLLLSACSSIKIVPEQTENGVINADDNSQTITRNGLQIRAGVSGTELNAYNLEGTVSAFNIAIKNSSDREVSFSADSFVLIDENGLQYGQLTPQKMLEMIKKDSYYLMPYPYVGFYYLEDFQKTSFYNRLNSSLPYYYELYPQDLFTKALPLTSIIPGMKVEGVIFFKIDMPVRRQVKLYVYRQGASRSNPPEFVFPFKVVK